MKETVFETNDLSDLTNLEDDEFVHANLIEEISADFYSWALIIDQVAHVQNQCDLICPQLEIKIDDFQLWDETSSDDGNNSATISLHLESLCIALEELEVKSLLFSLVQVSSTKPKLWTKAEH